MNHPVGLPDGLALTPPKGFATWNIWPFTPSHGRPAINESLSMHLAQALFDTGLAGAGYEYFVVQEPCFGGRDNATGELLQTGEFAQRWPHGLQAFGEFLRTRGMRLGIYTDLGVKTCGGCIGSGGHVAQDMKTFASWGADLIEVCVPPAPSINATACGCAGGLGTHPYLRARLARWTPVTGT